MALVPTHLRGHTSEATWLPDDGAELDASWQWRQALVCDAGHRHLRLRYFGDLSDYRQISNTDSSCQLINFECASCDDRFVGFDPKQHGYDAEIGNDWLKVGDRSKLSLYDCECGETAFDVVACVLYQPEPEEQPLGDPGNMFESITLDVRCTSCGIEFVPVEYETA